MSEVVITMRPRRPSSLYLNNTSGRGQKRLHSVLPASLPQKHRDFWKRILFLRAAEWSRGYNFPITAPSGGESLMLEQLPPESPLEAVNIDRRCLAVPFPWCFVHGREVGSAAVGETSSA